MIQNPENGETARAEQLPAPNESGRRLNWRRLAAWTVAGATLAALPSLADDGDSAVQASTPHEAEGFVGETNSLIGEAGPRQPGDTLQIQAEPNSIVFGTLTSIAREEGRGFAAIHAGPYEGTSTTNTKTVNVPTPNTFFAKTGDEGLINLSTFLTPQDHIVDITFQAPDSDRFQLLDTPERIYDSAEDDPDGRYQAGDVIRLVVDPEVNFSNRLAIINLTAASTDGEAWYDTYACLRGRNDTSTLNANDLRAALNFVQIDGFGSICIEGNKDARLVADLLGFWDFSTNLGKFRFIDTRTLGGPLDDGDSLGFGFINDENREGFALLQVTTTGLTPGTDGNGFISLALPGEQTDSSTLNPEAGTAVTIATGAKLDETGTVEARFNGSGGGSVQLIVDAFFNVAQADDLGMTQQEFDAIRDQRVLDTRTGMVVTGS